MSTVMPAYLAPLANPASFTGPVRAAEDPEAFAAELQRTSQQVNERAESPQKTKPGKKATSSENNLEASDDSVRTAETDAPRTTVEDTPSAVLSDDSLDAPTVGTSEEAQSEQAAAIALSITTPVAPSSAPADANTTSAVTALDAPASDSATAPMPTSAPIAIPAPLVTSDDDNAPTPVSTTRPASIVTSDAGIAPASASAVAAVPIATTSDGTAPSPVLTTGPASIATSVAGIAPTSESTSMARPMVTGGAGVSAPMSNPLQVPADAFTAESPTSVGVANNAALMPAVATAAVDVASQLLLSSERVPQVTVSPAHTPESSTSTPPSTPGATAVTAPTTGLAVEPEAQSATTTAPVTATQVASTDGNVTTPPASATTPVTTPTAPVSDATPQLADDVIDPRITAAAASESRETVTGVTASTSSPRSEAVATTARPDVLASDTDVRQPSSPEPSGSTDSRSTATTALASGQTAPVPSASTAPVVDRPQLDIPVAQQLSTHLTAFRGRPDGTYETTLRLNPEELGEVTIRLQVNGGSVSLHAMGASVAAVDALRDAMPDLRQDLQRSGLELVDSQVDQNPSSQARDAQAERDNLRSADRGAPSVPTIAQGSRAPDVGAVANVMEGGRVDVRI